MIIETFETYKKVSAEDGMMLTYFKEGDDIKNYTFARMVICPINNTLEDIREITEEEHLKLFDMMEDVIKTLQ